MSAAVPHTQLFLPESESEYTDEKRMLMDDLKISHGSVHATISRRRCVNVSCVELITLC